ncbi:class IV adenylate cyclase [Actinomadura violacea]|uniref:Class IV adenylate cyclase n=1 Tax=Actinomadura violacea TaxID=2819934 RepID=A0ABS3RYE4_9ACTN|nr:class IV adenylate cyclase [Actinomadura violacea]MBO2461760.1 class IV adenylate cyclase [Actinomadura violacea]
MKNTEVERKYAVTDGPALRERLLAAGAARQGHTRQVDVYYNHPARDFLDGYADGAPISEWLRLREDHHGHQAVSASINFKQWLPLGAAEATHANEFESQITDRQAVAALLDALGFTTLVTVDKHRERWMLGDVEIAIDDVAGLGAFVEFEYKGAGDLDQADTAITDAVKQVGDDLLGERDRRGYPYLLLTP